MNEILANSKIESQKSLKQWLLNPFKFVAGTEAMMLGLIVILAAAIIGWLGKTHFDGVLDVHTGSAAPMELLPLLGVPSRAIWPQPERCMWKMSRPAPLALWAACSLRALNFLRRSALRWSVPLCLGMTRSISSRARIFSSVVVAWRNHLSAFK